MSTSRVYPFAALNHLPFVEEETRFALAAEQTVPGVSAAGISEAFPLAGARSLYGMTKLAAELMVEEYADAYGLRCIVNRCGLLTGPWQMAKSDQGVMALWMAAHYFRRGLSYIGFQGTGKQVRDLLHIDDFCDLLVEQIRNFALYSGQCYNVGGGLANSLSLRETTHLCEEITGNTIPIAASADTRPADVRLYISDHRRISSVHGWQPRRDACPHLDGHLPLAASRGTRRCDRCSYLPEKGTVPCECLPSTGAGLCGRCLAFKHYCFQWMSFYRMVPAQLGEQ